MDPLVGPTEESNWIIPGKLIVGSCPITLEEMKDISEKGGVDLLVCLLDRDDFSSHISKKDYNKLAQEANMEVIFKPIADGDITSDKRASNISWMVYKALKEGDCIVYLHCWGGHGRAGTIGSMVLGLWYRSPFEKVIEFIQKSHQTRLEGGNYPTPQTKEQIHQILRFFRKEKISICS